MLGCQTTLQTTCRASRVLFFCEMGAATPPSEWTVAQVGEWLSDLGLPAELQVEFKQNAVDGRDLLSLSNHDLVTELKCTQLQVC